MQSLNCRDMEEETQSPQENFTMVPVSTVNFGLLTTFQQNLKRGIEDLEEYKVGTSKFLQQKEDELSRLRRKLDEKIAELEQVKSLSKEEINQRNERISELENKLQEEKRETESKLKEMERSIEESKEETTSLRNELVRLKEEHEKAMKEREEQEKAQKEQETEMADFQAMADVNEEWESRLQAIENEKAKEQEMLNSAISMTSEELLELKKNYESLQSRYEQLKAQPRLSIQSEGEIHLLKAKLAEKENEIRTLRVHSIGSRVYDDVKKEFEKETEKWKVNAAFHQQEIKNMQEELRALHMENEALRNAISSSPTSSNLSKVSNELSDCTDSDSEFAPVSSPSKSPSKSSPSSSGKRRIVSPNSPSKKAKLSSSPSKLVKSPRKGKLSSLVPHSFLSTTPMRVTFEPLQF